jgi:hypothetical protein
MSFFPPFFPIFFLKFAPMGSSPVSRSFPSTVPLDGPGKPPNGKLAVIPFRGDGFFVCQKALNEHLPCFLANTCLAFRIASSNRADKASQAEHNAVRTAGSKAGRFSHEAMRLPTSLAFLVQLLRVVSWKAFSVRVIAIWCQRSLTFNSSARPIMLGFTPKPLQS